VKQLRARIISNRPAGEDTFTIRIESEYLATSIVPGQFVHVRVHGGLDPLLRRPLSLHRRNAGEGWIELLFKVTGRGTRILAGREPGEDLDVIGPLGNGFPDPEDALCMVGGGMGVAPLGAVVEDVCGGGGRVKVLIGARSAAALLCVEEFQGLGAEVQVATEDGSAGFTGLVSELLGELPVPGGIFCCGPSGMTKAIVRYALEHDVRCWASVEERMGCGIGMCRGCAVPVAEGDGVVYKRVCRDGPVFTAGQLAVWARS
jgi:dihydroorotate dehydrogenase electron transfer subunit